MRIQVLRPPNLKVPDQASFYTEVGSLWAFSKEMPGKSAQALQSYLHLSVQA